MLWGRNEKWIELDGQKKYSAFFLQKIMFCLVGDNDDIYLISPTINCRI